MKYVIVNDNSIVATTDDQYGGLAYACNLYPKAKHLPLVNEIELLNDSQYLEDTYLITNGQITHLIQKIKKVSVGYIFTSEKYELIYLNTWTVFDVSSPVQKSMQINENQINGNQIMDDKVVTHIMTSVNDDSKDNILTSNISKNHNIVSDALLSQVPFTSSASSSSSPSSSSSAHNILMTDEEKNVKKISTKIDAENREQKNQLIMQKNKSRPRLALEDISKTPTIFSIGSTTKLHYEKIDMIINTSIIQEKIKEDNLIIVCDADDKKTKYWHKKYPSSLICDTCDEDILYTLASDVKTPIKDGYNKMIIFDDCLTSNFVQTKSFFNFINNHNDVAIIVMTRDINLIMSDMSTKYFSYVLLHGFVMHWTLATSHDFINKYKIAKDSNYLAHCLAECIRTNNCLAFHNLSPSKIFDF